MSGYCRSGNLSVHILIHVKSPPRVLWGSVMFNLLSCTIYRSMSFDLKCAVNSVALKLMLAPFISYSLSAVLACQHDGVNRRGHVTAGAPLLPLIIKNINTTIFKGIITFVLF